MYLQTFKLEPLGHLLNVIQRCVIAHQLELSKNAEASTEENQLAICKDMKATLDTLVEKLLKTEVKKPSFIYTF